jgi:hypothetical protein
MNNVTSIPFPTAPTARPTGYPYPAKACQCDHPVGDKRDQGHCWHCGHELPEIIELTFRDQARRTDSAGKRLAVAA